VPMVDKSGPWSLSLFSGSKQKAKQKETTRISIVGCTGTACCAFLVEHSRNVCYTGILYSFQIPFSDVGDASARRPEQSEFAHRSHPDVD
jgi:hypothetical protein